MTWFCPALLPDQLAAVDLAHWASEQEWPEGTVLKRANRLHCTLLYSPDEKGQAERIMRNEFTGGANTPSFTNHPAWDHEAWTIRVSAFTPKTPEAPVPVVVELHSFWLTQRWNNEQAEALGDYYGIEVRTFEKYNPHITIAELPPGAEFVWREPPHMHFKFQPKPVELRSHYKSLRQD